jgi:predicted aldo/keto reductase-like oxidoreductase
VQYRDYGKTGEKLAALGFGAMRLPQNDDYGIECIRRSFELGVNYIDTASGYDTGSGASSEVVVGRALKGWRDRVKISTKNPKYRAPGGPDEWWANLEQSLERLDTDHIDFYKVCHFLSWSDFEENVVPKGIWKAIEKARDQKLFTYTLFSSHDTPENIKRLIETDLFDGMLVQYNLLDRKNEDVMELAASKGMGVEIMGPIGGGRLGCASQNLASVVPNVASTPELALRFVLSNPNVSLALSGMHSVQMVEENCATASREEPLSDQEREQVVAALDENRRLSELYCTGCNYCMPCPQSVGIPQAFSAMNMHRVWGLTELAREHYARLGPDNREGLLQADACIECGICEDKCPQNIPIIEQLRETHETLGE